MKGVNNFNTWDSKGLNNIIVLPDLVEVRIALYDKSKNELVENLSWRSTHDDITEVRNVKRFGFHGTNGEYFDLDLMYDDFQFNLEFAGKDNSFVLKVSPFSQDDDIIFCIMSSIRWGKNGTIVKSSEGFKIEGESDKYDIKILGEFNTESYVNSDLPCVKVKSNSVFYIVCNSNFAEEEINRFLNLKRKETISETITGRGFLEDAPQSILKCLEWNTLYHPVDNFIYTPPSRILCIGNGSYGTFHMYGKDAFINSILYAIQDKELSYHEIHSIFKEFKDNKIPRLTTHSNMETKDLAALPIGSYAILKLYRQFGDKIIMEEYIEKLLLWNNWWKQNFLNEQYSLLLDPEDTNSMSVGLNSIYALDLWCISEIYRILGNKEKSAEYFSYFEKIRDNVNEYLWNDEKNMYYDRELSGNFKDMLYLSYFFTLLAAIPSEERAEDMIKNYLFNQDEFWGEYVLPGVSKKDVNKLKYPDESRIIPFNNFLIVEGLRRYRKYEESFILSNKNLNLFLNEWSSENHIHESYNYETGDGDDIKNSDPFYTSGSLLAYTALSEVIDNEVWGGIRFGGLVQKEAAVENFLIQGDRYSVTIGREVKVYKNEILFIHVNVPCIIFNLDLKSDTLKFSFKSKYKNASIRLHNVSSYKNLIIDSKEKTIESKFDREMFIVI